MYVDDTQTFAFSHDENELIVKLNSDLAQVRKWCIRLNQDSCLLGPPTI